MVQVPWNTPANHRSVSIQYRFKCSELPNKSTSMSDARNIQTKRNCCDKLDVKKLGPFPIEQKLNNNAYDLELPTTYRIHNVLHVSLLSPYHARPQTPNAESSQITSRTSQVIDIPNKLIIESVLHHKQRHRSPDGPQYYIKWKNMTSENNTWMTRKQILDLDPNGLEILERYDQNRKHTRTS